MRFPFVLTRYHGTAPAGGKAIGSDAVPTTRADLKGDNVFQFSTTDEMGVALRTLALAVNIPNTSSIEVAAYIWEEATESWYAAADTDGITSGMLINAFAFPSPPRSAIRSQNSSAIGQSVAVAFVMTTAGSVDGTYTIAACPSA